MIKQITHESQLLAIIVSHKFNESGVHFFTDDNLSQQLAFMKHDQGRIIQPHVHNPIVREICDTQEVLFIKKGSLRVDFYAENQDYLESTIVEAGDVVVLIQGGHGLEVMEDLEMFEVKQGPYGGDKEKTRFVGISAEKARFKKSECY